MIKRAKNTIPGVVIGIVLAGAVVGLALYNMNSRYERGARDSDTLYKRVSSEAKQMYGEGQRQPVVMMKEEGAVLVYYGYASYKEKGYYEIYTLSEKYAEQRLWNGPKEKGELAEPEGEKTIDVNAGRQGKYQVTISFAEKGRPVIEIEEAD